MLGMVGDTGAAGNGGLPGASPDGSFDANGFWSDLGGLPGTRDRHIAAMREFCE